MKILNRYQKSLSGAKVLVLGVAYKKDIDDYRESPVMEIIKLLESYEANFELVDPHISSFRLDNKNYETVALTEEKLKEADLVLITTDHSAFDYQQIGDMSSAIFDTRNAMKDIKNIKAYYEKL
jgi:UDP-N-acetyl-D-glucosamine dehydrogenase